MATKEEWGLIIEQEEGEELILNLLEDIIHQSHQILFKKHIDVQILPYTVQFASNTIMDAIHFNFFTRDAGNSDPTLWIVDEEPLHVDTDSWARNSIPIRSLEKHYKKIPQEIEVAEVIEEEKKKVVKKRLSIMKQPEVPIVKVKKRASASIAPAAVRVQRNEPTYDLNRMISEENQRTLTRAQTTDKDQPTQDYTFDPDGRLIPLVQPHWTVPVNVKAKVQAVEKPKMEPKAPNTAREKKAAKQKTPRMSVLKSPVDGFIEDPTLNMDTIKLAPGVTLREGDLVKSVPPIKVSLVYKDDSSDAQLSVLNQIIANVQPLQEPKDRKSVAIQK